MMIAACGQLAATTMDHAAGVWPAMERMTARAAAAGADLLVLPETTYPAYWLESAKRYRADDIERSAKVLERFGSLARQHRLWIVAGFVEECDDVLHNSAAVFDRSGRLVGIARKNFLWDCDNRWFAPGERISVFESEFGRMGVLICADGRAPEISATLVERGATFAVMPTAWVNARAFSGAYFNAQAEFLIRARAIEFQIPYICASKSGREDDHLEYVGQSQIVDRDGTVLARAPIDGEHLLVAGVRPQPGRPALVDAAERDRLLSRTPPPRMEGNGPIVALDMALDAAGVEAALRSAGGRAQSLSADHLDTFVPTRLAAFGGVQAIVADGRPSNECLARARAAENRVYVVIVDRDVLAVIDPAGLVVWRREEAKADHGPIRLDLSRADDKHFTPETNIWEQRRTGCYDFGLSPPND